MDELASKLQDYLSVRRNNDSIIVEEFTKLSAGSEAEKYSFVEISIVDTETIANKFLLRMYPDYCDSYGVKNEFT